VVQATCVSKTKPIHAKETQQNRVDECVDKIMPSVPEVTQSSIRTVPSHTPLHIPNAKQWQTFLLLSVKFILALQKIAAVINNELNDK